MTDIVKERDEGENRNHSSMPILIFCTLLPPLIGLTGLIAMLFPSKFLKTDQILVFYFTAFKELNIEFTKQIYVLFISSAVIIIMYFYDPSHFKKFFRIGDIFAPIKALPILGIKEEYTWKQLGPTIIKELIY